MRRYIPYTSREAFQDGDLIFAYRSVVLFQVFVEQPDLSVGIGYDPIFLIDGETCNVLLVATVSGMSFYVHWWPNQLKSVEATAESGHRMHNETTARRYFPHLADYTFQEGTP